MLSSTNVGGDPAAYSGDGFTLVEVMLALAVLTAGLLSLVLTLTTAIYQNEVAREYDLAVNAAVAKIQEIRGHTPFSGATGTFATYNNTTFDVAGIIRAGTDQTADNGEVVINNANPDLLDVTVKISFSWTNPATDSSKLLIRTYVARSGAW
ncbi:MAG: hypothetical protein HY762_02490 [Planctomycetes bacterium]|nr:hypothetical protein [Planctomycetota bacterium]